MALLSLIYSSRSLQQSFFLWKTWQQFFPWVVPCAVLKKNRLRFKSISLGIGETLCIFFHVAKAALVPYVWIAPLGIGLLRWIYETFWAKWLLVVPMLVVTYGVFVRLYM